MQRLEESYGLVSFPKLGLLYNISMNDQVGGGGRKWNTKDLQHLLHTDKAIESIFHFKSEEEGENETYYVFSLLYETDRNYVVGDILRNYGMNFGIYGPALIVSEFLLHEDVLDIYKEF